MIGIDITTIARIEQLIKRFQNRSKNRFMTSNEQKWAIKVQSIAGIWATKEAFSKAIGTGIGKKFSFTPKYFTVSHSLYIRIIS